MDSIWGPIGVDELILDSSFLRTRIKENVRVPIDINAFKRELFGDCICQFTLVGKVNIRIRFFKNGTAIFPIVLTVLGTSNTYLKSVKERQQYVIIIRPSAKSLCRSKTKRLDVWPKEERKKAVF